MAYEDLFLAPDLVHYVDVGQPLGHNDYGFVGYQWYRRIPCLIDQASGKRRQITEQGTLVTYAFGITLGNRIRPEISWLLEDGRDEDGELILTRATVETIQTYRVPGQGIVGYLLMANSREPEV
jgi:hypothetical protein